MGKPGTASGERSTCRPRIKGSLLLRGAATGVAHLQGRTTQRTGSPARRPGHHPHPESRRFDRPRDPGIAGAIRKRLWKLEPTDAHLAAAIELYGRGFEVKGDYYNGENYALCLDWRANKQTDPAEAVYGTGTTARKVRGRIRDSLALALAEPTAQQRSDYHWMLASMANAAYAVGDVTTASDHEARFRALGRPDWEVKTFEGGKEYALKLAGAKP